MLSAVTSVAHAQTVAPTDSSSQKQPQPKSQALPTSSSTDTVQLSSAAQAALASIKEAQETPAQTAKEASGGDPQARRLLAREAAATTGAGQIFRSDADSMVSNLYHGGPPVAPLTKPKVQLHLAVSDHLKT